MPGYGPIDGLKNALRPMPSHQSGVTLMDPSEPMASHSILSGGPPKREDGSLKGQGFFGSLDSGIDEEGYPSVSSEVSIANRNFGGKDFPSMVPTLNQEELRFILNAQDARASDPEGSHINHGGFPAPIEQKATEFARQRQAAGQPFFAQPGEENPSLMPQFRRRQ